MTHSLPASTPFPADWYDDPNAPGGRVKRYWDGTAWTEFVYDLGVDIAAPVPGPGSEAPAISLVDPMPDTPEVAETTEPAALEAAPEDTGRKVGFFGSRKAAKRLAQENDELQRQVSDLAETIARYEAELAKLESVPFDG